MTIGAQNDCLSTPAPFPHPHKEQEAVPLRIIGYGPFLE